MRAHALSVVSSLIPACRSSFASGRCELGLREWSSTPTVCPRRRRRRPGIPDLHNHLPSRIVHLPVLLARVAAAARRSARGMRRVAGLLAALVALSCDAATFTSPLDPSVSIDPKSMAENAKNCMFLYQSGPVRTRERESAGPARHPSSRAHLTRLRAAHRWAPSMCMRSRCVRRAGVARSAAVQHAPSAAPWTHPPLSPPHALRACTRASGLRTSQPGCADSSHPRSGAASAGRVLLRDANCGSDTGFGVLLLLVPVLRQHGAGVDGA